MASIWIVYGQSARLTYVAKTPARSVRIPDDLWNELQTHARQVRTDSSTVLRELARLWIALAKGDAELAARLVREEPAYMARLREALMDEMQERPR